MSGNLNESKLVAGLKGSLVETRKIMLVNDYEDNGIVIYAVRHMRKRQALRIRMSF